MPTQRLSTLLGYVASLRPFISYLVRRFPLFYLVTALTLLVLALDYIATSLMVPMSLGPSSSDGGSIARFWNGIAGRLDLAADFRTWLWLFLCLMTARVICAYLVTAYSNALGKQVHRTLSRTVFDHILFDEPMMAIYRRSIGHYLVLAGDDTFKSGTIATNLLQSIVGMLSALVALLILYKFSSTLFVGVVGFLIVTTILIAFLVRSVIRINLSSAELSREATTTFVEGLNSLRSIRSLHHETYLSTTYAEQMRRYTRALLKLDIMKGSVRTVPAILLLLIAVALLRPGASISLENAKLLAATFIVMRIFTALGQMVSAASQLITDIRSINDIGSLIQLTNETHLQAHETAPMHKDLETLSLEAVSFGYDEQDRVLDGVSFSFHAGKTYAIIGQSGSGKSTLADIVLGLIPPNSGAIKINNGSLSKHSRERFILVEQSPKIFSTSIRDNLLMGQEASDEDLYGVLEVVNLLEMVQGMEHGLDTKLTYLGENISGGQRQRIGIARALVRTPEVLILDEATSALDPETRTEVVAKLRVRMREGIIIFITHDPEIAELADEILPIGAMPPEMGTKADQ
jgi:ABC-type bacteriocin/lantibiotic exporter with double-glycine peptidase domain